MQNYNPRSANTDSLSFSVLLSVCLSHSVASNKHKTEKQQCCQ